MSHVIRAIVVFLVTTLVLGPLVGHLRVDNNLWILAALVGVFILVYDIIERRVSRKYKDAARDRAKKY